MKQLKMFKDPPVFHGGGLFKGKRKGKRPLCRKRAIHLEIKANRSIWKHRKLILERITRFAEKNHIRLYDFAPNFNHVHVAIRIPSRLAYVRFIRALMGSLGRILGKGLFEFIPFTRVVAWGQAYRELRAYFLKNRLEVSGDVPYTPRKDWYRRYRGKS